MPRYARLHFPGGVFHIISRCLNREFLIDGPDDRAKYLELVGRALVRSDASVLAYCLMSNHVHLVVRAGDDPLEKLVKPIHTGYALWKNRRAGRLGPLFAGRFSSPLVDADEYLLELVRYVHNNPVRAGVVPTAEASDWSSQRAYVGLCPPPDWLNVGEVLARFDALPEAARRAFAAFVAEGADEARRADLTGAAQQRVARAVATDVGDGWRVSQPLVGDEAFARKVFADLERSEGVPEAQADTVPTRRPSIDELVAHASAVLGLNEWEFVQQPSRRRPHTARLLVTWIWVHVFHGTQTEVARALKTSTANVSNWYGGAVRNLPELQPVIDEVLKSLPGDAPLVAWDTARRVQFRLVAPYEPDSRP
jgi:REP element-mobilizing transposase RayT